jgi:hypothetical protein
MRGSGQERTQQCVIERVTQVKSRQESIHLSLERHAFGDPGPDLTFQQLDAEGYSVLLA